MIGRNNQDDDDDDNDDDDEDDEDDDDDEYEVQVIEEVITPAATPVFERDQQPAVKMPGVPR